MGPPDRTPLVLAAVATAAVAVVSYFVVKRRHIAGKKVSPQKGYTGEFGTSSSQKVVSEVPLSQGYQVQQDIQPILEKHHIEDTEKNNGDDEKKVDNLSDNGQQQASFIILGNGEGTGSTFNGQNARKSDRSSDESSYDVIEDDDDDQLVEGEVSEDVEKDDSGNALDSSSGQQLSEAYVDPNETSMVIIDDITPSNSASRSESSLYVTADKNLYPESQLEKLDDGADQKELVESVDVSEEDISVTELGSHEPSAETTNISSSHGSSSTTADVVHQSEISTSDVHFSEQYFSAHSRSRSSPPTTLEVTQFSAETSDEPFNASDVTQVLTTCQNSPSTVSKENISTLVDLLRREIPELHSTVLSCVLRVAAFTQNVKALRENGCLRIVAVQVQNECQKSVSEGEGQADMLNSLCQVLTNLTLDPKCQDELEDTVHPLVDLLLRTDVEATRLSVLRPLINFSSQFKFHGYFTQAVQTLFTLLEASSHVARVQSSKVLVNLSLGKELVPHMLAAKAPSCLLELLDLPTPTDLTLRTLTLLTNIKMAMHDGNISLASLPVVDKAASHETMYIALHGVNNISNLRSRVFRLTRHANEDVSQQASKLHQLLQQMTA